MAENTPPTPPDSSPSQLESALKQIQEWFVNGEFEKVKKGCSEVLSVNPHNSIAQDLLKKTEETIAAPTPQMDDFDQGTAPAEDPTAMGETSPYPVAEDNDLGTAPAQELEEEPVPIQETQPEPVVPISEPVTQPLGEVTPDNDSYSMSEPIPEMDTIPGIEPVENTMSDAPEEEHEEYHKGHSMLINIGILVAIIIIGIGIVYGYNAFFGDKADVQEEATEEIVIEDEEVVEEENTEEETVENEEETDEEETDSEDSIDTRNEKRLSDLTTIENALINYYDEHKQYPDADEINTVLVEEELINEMPLGPEEENYEVYAYAVYSTDLGPNQVYILSAQFENEDGSYDVWTTGGHTETYSDYSEIDQDHVTIIHPTMTEDEYIDSLFGDFELDDEETIDEEEVEDDEPVRIPRT